MAAFESAGRNIELTRELFEAVGERVHAAPRFSVAEEAARP